MRDYRLCVRGFLYMCVSARTQMEHICVCMSVHFSYTQPYAQRHTHTQINGAAAGRACNIGKETCPGKDGA